MFYMKDEHHSIKNYKLSLKLSISCRSFGHHVKAANKRRNIQKIEQKGVKYIEGNKQPK